MDPSYKAHLAEQEVSKAAAVFANEETMAYLSVLLSEDASLGVDGAAGMMVGRPFGPFAGGNGFAG